ncbi:uncharacterized protein [Drosophila takahashii]|uniref:uncharacterized protein n=1 Tax=Drosophila takahashii TaxID=29030 RepID=UPI0007E60000|nr:uncharacterized protein LOC108069921 [Drosophila takahashii]
MRSITIVLTIITFLFACDIGDSVIFRMTNVECISHNKSWVRVNMCRLKAISRYKVVFNFNATLFYPTPDIRVTYRVFKRENGYKPWMINVEIDSCRFLRKPYNVFGVMIYNFFRNFTNANHTCPLSGDLIVKNMYLTTEPFKGLPWPTGEYLFAMNWKFFRKPQFDTNVSFQFIEDLLQPKV